MVAVIEGFHCIPSQIKVRLLSFFMDLIFDHRLWSKIRSIKQGRFFFHFGSVYAFQDTLSPISACSIIQSCILLYGLGHVPWIYQETGMFPRRGSKKNSPDVSQQSRLHSTRIELYPFCVHHRNFCTKLWQMRRASAIGYIQPWLMTWDSESRAWM